MFFIVFPSMLGFRERCFFIFIVIVKKPKVSIFLLNSALTSVRLHESQDRAMWSWCNTLQHPNELVAYLQHHPFNIKTMIFAAQHAPILTYGIDIWHSQISYRICGPIGRKMKQRDNTIYGFWTCPEVKTVDAFIIVWWEKTAKWLVARVHKLTCTNAVHWASQEKLAE